jgi:predicted permease
MIGDVIHACRALARTPIMAAVVMLSLGLGIGVNTVVFSWIQTFVLRPMPGVEDASRFHLIEPHTDAGLRPGVSWPEYVDLRDRLQSFEGLVSFRMVPLNVGDIGRTERHYGLLVSGNYFSSLGLRPAMGRFLGLDETTTPGGSPVAVISQDYWRSRMGGAPDAIGRTIRINGSEMTIVGVTPEGFQGTVLGLQFDFWVPATMAPVLLSGSRELEDRRVRGYYVMGSLRAGVSIQQAQADTAAAMQRLAQTFPESNASLGALVLPFWRAGRGPQGLLLEGLAILQGVMLVLLLTVCGNTANLMLARASTRLREIGVRLAVGAGTWRIARLLLVESLLLGVVAAVIGAVLALWGTNALRAMPLFSTQFPVKFQTDLDGTTLAFAVGLGVVCALAFGAVPAIQLARLSPQFVLRSGGSVPARGGIRTAIMALQVTLAAIVLVVAGIFLKSFQQSRQTDPGFRPAGVLIATYDLSGRNADRAEARQFAERVLSGLRGLPDVESAALAVSVPLDIHGLPSREFEVEGRARTDGTRDRALSNTVTSGYFATMGIPFVAGGDFVELKDTAAPAQAVVNQEFVKRYIGEGEPLGRRVTVGDTAYAIVGIVRTTLNDSFSEPPTATLYLSFRDRPSSFAEMHLRTRLGDETVLAQAARGVVRNLDASLPVYNVRTLTQHVEMNLALRRIPAQMFMVLGPLILVLAAIGIYAVVAYNVAHRTAEIGVRMALGASAGNVLRQILGENLRVIVAAALVGWAFVAYFYTRFLRGELDPTAFVAVPVLLLVVAGTACWVPARRASRIDPMAALRAE